MRANKYVALASGMSRRSADIAIARGEVTVNDQPATTGQDITSSDSVKLNEKPLNLPVATTIMLNKPVGYVCSRDGQGSKTIYELIPQEFHNLKPVGRLDKDSSGLILLTNDGDLANQLTHPRYQKEKEYLLSLDKNLLSLDQSKINEGVLLDDGISKLKLVGEGEEWKAIMSEGRNRQIRRTFLCLGYQVRKLHRVSFGSHQLGDLVSGKFKIL